MTGKKNRYSSVEQLWKIDDETLKTPKHDEMVLYLLNEDNVKAIFPEIAEYLKETRVVNYHLDGIGSDLIMPGDFWARLEFGADISIKDAMGIIEWCKEKYGFDNYGSPEAVIDKWKSATNEYHSKSLKIPRRKITVRSEVPIMANNNFLVGYWDIVITLEEPHAKGTYFGRVWKDANVVNWNLNPPRIGPPLKFCPQYFIEVKPKITSFGATLRQIRTYQEYEKRSLGNTYLFTDDLRFKDAFESQGIRVRTRNGEKDDAE